jgi:NADH-ubiquinone oxidoreductase chain 5
MLIAGIAATLEGDIKKIIALSTLRQLGVIITRLALGFTNLTFFHLVTHALFKALLFVCAGCMIHLHHHSQDLRFIGGVSSQMPLLISSMLISNFALCGSPFLAGFYSKDIIIESSLFLSFNTFISGVFLLATALTAAYSTRFLIAVVFSPALSLPISPVNDKDYFIHTPTLNLRTGAVTAGAIISWFALTPLIDPILTPQYKISALVVTLLGILIVVVISNTAFTLKTFFMILISPPHFFITSM